MKGAFEQKPSIPLKSRTSTWDPQQVLNFLENWFPHDSITLKELSLKMTMFLALLSGQRSQTVHSLDIKHMKITENKCVFYIDNLLKHSRKGHHQEPIEFLKFTDNKKLCIIDIIEEYLRRTKDFRTQENGTKLLLSYQAPHKPVSKDTVKRWIKVVMEMAGIDIDIFTPHSTRAASTSYASKEGVSIKTILSAAGWSQENTFAKFYKKEVKTNFGQKIIETYFKRK